MTNPFFSSYDTPYGVPPFDKIKNEHYVPAFEKGMQEHNADIDSIIGNTDAPTFENTILAYENSGDLLNRVSLVFFNITEADTNDTLDSIAEHITPLITAHFDEIALNEKLFGRIKPFTTAATRWGLKVKNCALRKKYTKDSNVRASTCHRTKRNGLKP